SRKEEMEKDRKSGALAADPGGERKPPPHGKPPVFHKYSRAVAQVLQKVRNHFDPPVGSEHDRFLRRRALDPPQFPLKRLAGAQCRERQALRFLRRRAARERLLVTIIEMLRNLIDHSRLARRYQVQMRQLLTDPFIPFAHL